MNIISKHSRLIIKIMWVTFGIALVSVFIILFLIYNGSIGYMPAVEELKNPKDRFASVIYSSEDPDVISPEPATECTPTTTTYRNT